MWSVYFICRRTHKILYISEYKTNCWRSKIVKKKFKLVGKGKLLYKLEIKSHFTYIILFSLVSTQIFKITCNAFSLTANILYISVKPIDFIYALQYTLLTRTVAVTVVNTVLVFRLKFCPVSLKKTFPRPVL